ncbi:MAG: uroporphyrinogen-III C-methyltransferase [Alphaproteobacteria bacterium]|nr:uroporphyrinogen-III C-methyltransferase [Alphaproteobacteria bacterium]
MDSIPTTSISLSTPDFTPGSVWLVGAGPGSPDLLTIAAYQAIKLADVIVYDALVSEAILDMASPATKLVFAGKRGGKPSIDQNDITHKLINFAHAGLKVLRLKGGDPLIFARGGEELLQLAEARIPFHVVPGVTAANAAAAAIPLPLTLREYNSSVVFITGHQFSDELTQILSSFARGSYSKAMVVYMGLLNLQKIASYLVDQGYNSENRLVLVSDVSNSNQKAFIERIGFFCDANYVQRIEIQPPAIIILGSIVQYYERLSSTIKKSTDYL